MPTYEELRRLSKRGLMQKINEQWAPPELTQVGFAVGMFYRDELVRRSQNRFTWAIIVLTIAMLVLTGVQVWKLRK